MRPTTPGTLNSSAGFKGKRTLGLPRLTKRDEESKEQSPLPVLLDSAEAANPALFRTYLAELQDAINLQDLDRKIRAAEPGLSSGQAMALRKWLRLNWDSPTDRE
jgi:hypothetical protein